MSTRAIILWVVLFTSALNAWTDTLNDSQLKAERTINETVMMVKRISKETNKSIFQIQQKYIDVVSNFERKIWYDMQLGNSKVNSRLKKLTDISRFTDITNCYEYSNQVIHEGNLIFNKMVKCIRERLKLINPYNTRIRELFEEEFAKLTAIGKEAKHCVNDIRYTKSPIEAMLCTKNVENKGRKHSSELIPNLETQIKVIESHLPIFEKSVDGCARWAGVFNFHKAMSTVVNKTSKCIYQRIVEACTTPPDMMIAIRSFTHETEVSNKALKADKVCKVPVRIAQHRAHEIIDGKIVEFQENFKAIQRTNEQIVKNISAKTNNYRKIITDEIILVEREMNFKIGKVAANAIHFKISDCIQYFQHLNDVVKSAISNLEVCIANHLTTGFHWIENIDKLFKDESARLSTIRKEIQNCSDNVHDIDSAFASIWCMETVSDNAKRISPKFDEKLTEYTAMLNFSLAHCQQSLDHCMSTNGIFHFHNEASIIEENTYKCIQRKIDEVHAVPLKPNTTKYISNFETEWNSRHRYTTKRTYYHSISPIIAVL